MRPDLFAIAAAAKQAGFGEAVPEHHFALPERKWRFDLAWPALKVGFERHGASWAGGHHTRGKGFRDDREKMNAAQARGWIVIEATVDMIEDGSALEQLLAALESRRCPT